MKITVIGSCATATILLLTACNSDASPTATATANTSSTRPVVKFDAPAVTATTVSGPLDSCATNLGPLEDLLAYALNEPGAKIIKAKVAGVSGSPTQRTVILSDGSSHGTGIYTPFALTDISVLAGPSTPTGGVWGLGGQVGDRATETEIPLAGMAPGTDVVLLLVPAADMGGPEEFAIGASFTVDGSESYVTNPCYHNDNVKIRKSKAVKKTLKSFTYRGFVSHEFDAVAFPTDELLGAVRRAELRPAPEPSSS